MYYEDDDLPGREENVGLCLGSPLAGNPVLGLCFYGFVLMLKNTSR